jgi:hypothetical protein
MRAASVTAQKLAQELRLVRKGEFQRYLDIRSPQEVGELSRLQLDGLRLAKLDEMKEDFIAHLTRAAHPLTAIREGDPAPGRDPAR